MNKLSYEEFKSMIIGNIAGYMPEEYSNLEICVKTVYKNNCTLEGLIFEKKGDQFIAPTFYFQDMYSRYMAEDCTSEDFLKDLAKMLVESFESIPPEVRAISLGDIPAIDEMKVSRQLVMKKGNESLLEEVPYNDFLDLAIIYRWDISDSTSTIITQDMMEKHGGTLIQLENRAEACEQYNPHKVLKYGLLGMGNSGFDEKEMDMEDDAQIDDREETMLVLTNATRCMGANALLDEGSLYKIAKRLNCSYFILPSSIHECVLVPDYEGKKESQEDLNRFKEIIASANETVVETKDVLSYSVYYYDKKNCMVEIVA